MQVDTGGAVVYGMPYKNTAALNLVVPSPTNDTRQDRIVLRRDWDAQTIRATRIAGSEGGGVPAMIQSPAPAGSGIYDIPLATLGVTTGGVITVTDARQYCLYGGVPGVDAFSATNLTDASVDWSDRPTRLYRIFRGGGQLEPALNASQMYYSSSSYVTMTGLPGWGVGAGNVQGWQLTGSAYEGAYVTLEVPPPNYAGGDIYSYLWWAPNVGAASTFYLRSQGYYGHAWPSANKYGYWVQTSYSTVYINETTVANQFYRTQGMTLPMNSWIQYYPWYEDYHRRVIHYLAYWYNAAGAEDIHLLGIEFEYLGYI